MTDQDLLQAIGQVIEAKMEPMRHDIHELKEDVRGMRENYTRLEQRMDRLESKVGALDQRVGSLEDRVMEVRVYIDTELKRTLDLLLEGQQALWNRFVPHEEFDPLEERVEVLELTVKRHSQEIRELQLA